MPRLITQSRNLANEELMLGLQAFQITASSTAMVFAIAADLFFRLVRR